MELATLAADPDRVDAVAPASIPVLLGRLEELRARLEMRLLMATASHPGPDTGNRSDLNEAGNTDDHLITVTAAAEMLAVDNRWIYRRVDELPFVRRLGERTLRCSARGIQLWLDTR
jgi:hypothetical protein